MHPIKPDAAFLLEMSAEDARNSFGISPTLLDGVCAVMKLDPKDFGSYFTAAHTFHDEMFELMRYSGIKLPRTSQDMDWKAVHSAIDSKEFLSYMALQLFSKYHQFKQLNHGRDPAIPRPLTDTQIGLIIVETNTFASQVGLETPNHPDLNALASACEHAGRIERKSERDHSREDR